VSGIFRSNANVFRKVYLVQLNNKIDRRQQVQKLKCGLVGIQVKETLTHTRTGDMIISVKSTFLPYWREVNKDHNTLHKQIHFHHIKQTQIILAQNIFQRERSRLLNITAWSLINLLKPTGYVMHQQFNIQQLYALPTLYLCVLYLSENKQRLVPLTA